MHHSDLVAEVGREAAEVYSAVWAVGTGIARAELAERFPNLDMAQALRVLHDADLVQSRAGKGVTPKYRASAETG